MIAIIGGSIAAFVAYKTLKSMQPNLDIKVFSKERIKPYSKMLLPYMLLDNVEDNMFYSIGEDLILGREVVEINPHEKYIKDSTNSKYYFDKAIIATGADAKQLNFEGDYDKNKVLTIRYIDDIYKIRKLIAAAKKRHVVMVGGGLVSMEMGYALNVAGFKISFVIGSNRIFSQILNKSSADFVEGLIVKNHSNVDFYKQDGIEYLQDCDGGILARLKSGKNLECDFVVVGRGVKPNVSFLNGDFDDGIEVDEFLKTQFDDIYAVGDVVKSIDATTSVKQRHAIWPVAVEQAAIAAKNILGAHIKEEPQISRNVVPVFGLNIFSGGVSKLDEYDKVLEEIDDESLGRVLIKDNMLDGFAFVSDLQNFGSYVNVARRRLSVKGFERNLLSGAGLYKIMA